MNIPSLKLIIPDGDRAAVVISANADDLRRIAVTFAAAANDADREGRASVGIISAEAMTPEEVEAELKAAARA